MSEKKKNAQRHTLFSLGYIVCVITVSALLALAAIFLSNDLFALVKEDKEITITIPEGATVSDVSKILDENHVIQFGGFFKLFVNITAHDTQFRAGVWTVNSDMDYRELLRNVRLSDYSTVTVTIPEGYTIEDIRDAVVKSGLSSKEEFMDTVKNGEFDYDFLPEANEDVQYRLEGYLFPDTYEFYLSDDAETIIKKMLGHFETKINQKNENGDSIVSLCEKRGISISEATIIASMVQMESAGPDYDAKIAGVVYNRLNNPSKFPYLNFDSTLLYIRTDKKSLVKADLDDESPYNTYNHKGLPPGPICNPGYSQLSAAVNPEEHDYYYFVTDKDGTYHIFSKTLQEHNQAVASLYGGD
ncbi:MAG: endolytic transglycosylase MltG [Butyricicoccaceae bacterium]